MICQMCNGTKRLAHAVPDESAPGGYRFDDGGPCFQCHGKGEVDLDPNPPGARKAEQTW